MANLRLQVGQLTAQVDATDQNATRILQAMLAQRGHDVANMSGQEQADAVLAILVQLIVESATAHEVNVARMAAINDPPSFD